MTFLLAASLASAQDAPSDTAARLTAAIAVHVSEAIAVPAGDVEVVHLGATWESCAAPEQEHFKVEARSGEDYLGPTDLRITVLDGDEVCGSHRIKPRLARWVSLPVAAEAAAPGTVITLTTKRTRLDATGAAPVRLEDGPFIALTTLHSGEPVTATRARPQPDADGGRSVQVEIHRGGMTIRCEGVLVGDASIGQPARARCATTGRVISGTLTSIDNVTTGG